MTAGLDQAELAPDLIRGPVLGEVIDGPGLHALLRARREQLGVSLDVLADLSGLSYVSKLLMPRGVHGPSGRRVGRPFTTDSLGPVLESLAVKLVLEVDEAAEARLKRHAKYAPRNERSVRSWGNAWSPSTLDDLIRHRVNRRLAGWGKCQSWGGQARARVLSAEQRREIARQGALARWGKRRPISEESLP